MAESEAKIQHAILLDIGRDQNVTLYRNNTGRLREEWITIEHLKRMLSMVSGCELRELSRLITSLINAPSRWITYGLCVGSSDIIGIVTAQSGAGIFLALEVKRHGKQPTKEQQMFIDLVNRRGGVADCVHSVAEARAAVSRARAL